MLIQRLSIIGVGLIGGSLARALKRAGVCGEVVGCGRDITHLQQGLELGVIDRYTTNPAQAVVDADLVVVAVPLGYMAASFLSIREALAPQAIITDVGSAKASVVEAARQHLGPHLPHFVPGHPIAGTEKSGVAASFPELFENRRVILTPLPETQAQALAKVTAMWSYTGAQVVEMPIAYHDEVLAATSHLPHMLAYNLVDTLTQLDSHRDIFRFAAGGLRDFTRIASSDPKMWHDICLANRDAILHILATFTQHLTQLTKAIETCDSQHLTQVFTRAKTARDQWLLH